MMRFLELIGRHLLHFTKEIGRVLLLFSSTIRHIFTPPVDAKLILKQMVEVGIRSVPIVLITGVFTGMVLALQSYIGFRRFGAESMVGAAVAMSMTRELGPVLTGIMVTGRAGAAMAAELGTMRVTEQIDALETLATNPVKYLIVPRFLASVVMVPALVVITDFVGILGGYVITVGALGANSTTYWKRTFEFLELDDIYCGLVKACFFGGCMALISCYKGFYSEGGAEGVGKATTGAVVVSSMSILVSDYFLSAWMF
jgi:phospholipid/cholesterol/gamma-HCH transport system permease protein